MKTVHDYPEVKTAQATLDEAQRLLSEVQAEYQSAASRWRAKHRDGPPVEPVAASDAIANLLAGDDETDGQRMRRLEAREAQLSRAVNLARTEFLKAVSIAGQTLRKDLEPKVIELRKETLLTMKALAAAMDAEDQLLKEMAEAGAVEGVGSIFLGHMDGGLTALNLKHVLREQTVDLERREVTSGVSTGDAFRIRLLVDTLIQGEWYRLNSVLELPFKDAMLLILDAAAEKTSKPVKADRGRSPGQNGLQPSAIWG